MITNTTSTTTTNDETTSGSFAVETQHEDNDPGVVDDHHQEKEERTQKEVHDAVVFMASEATFEATTGPPPVTTSRQSTSSRSSLSSSTSGSSIRSGRAAPMSSSLSNFNIRPMIVIVCTVVFIAISVGSTISIVPKLMTNRFANINHGYEGNDCSTYDNNKMAGNMTKPPQECIDGSNDARNANSISNLVSNAFTLLLSSYIGSLSDQYGRRIFLILGMMLMSLSPMGLLYIQLNHSANPYVWYYSVQSVQGIISFVAICISSISDVLPKEYRGPGVGLIMGGFLFGISISPLMAIVVNNDTHILVFSVCMVVLAVIVTVCFYTETLPQHVQEEAILLRRRQREDEEAEEESSNAVERVLKNAYAVASRPIYEMSILNRDTLFRLLSCLAFCSGIVSSGDQTLLLYYIQDQLNFTSNDIAYYLSIVGILGFSSQIVLLKPMLNCVHGERNLIILCFVVATIQNVLYGIVESKVMVFVAGSLSAITIMSFPIISSIKSNNVDEFEQGRIQGALYSLQAIASAIGPISMQFVDHLANKEANSDTTRSLVPRFLQSPGTMFYFSACIQFIAVGFAYALPKDKTDFSTRIAMRTRTVPSSASNRHVESRSSPFDDDDIRPSEFPTPMLIEPLLDAESLVESEG